MDQLDNWAEDGNGGKTKILFIDESNIEDTNFMIFAPLKEGGNKRILYNSKFYELTENHKVIFAGNQKEYGGGRSDQKLFADGSIPEIHLKDFPACYIYEKILKESIYDKLSENIKGDFPEGVFKKKCHQLIKDYQEANNKKTETLTVRELQERVLRFLTEKTESLSAKNTEPEVKTKEFISTNATKETEAILTSSLKVRQKQRDEELPNEAVGINGVIFEGDTGTGKSEMIRAVLESNGIKEQKMTDSVESIKEKKPHYYKIDANLPIEEKKEIILKAFREGNIVWIDELNSCIDDGLEKILNAVLTGHHPENNTKSENPGFMVIASINQISLEGRSPISPALLHRMQHHKTKPLSEYKVEDLKTIIGHHIEEIGGEKRDSGSAQIIDEFARDFYSAIKAGEKHNLRDLKRVLMEDFVKKEVEVVKDRPGESPSPISSQSSQVNVAVRSR